MRTMAVRANLTSAAGVLSLLNEPESEIKVFALQRLDELVGDFWAEIAEAISKIEELYEDAEFPERELSALVASKVYYHLGAFELSLMYALGAGEKFDVNGTSEFIETIISKCIDHYTKLRVKRFEGETDETFIDPRLESIVNRMFQRCLHDGRYKQAVGIAIETRRIDVLQEAIEQSNDIPGMLAYSMKVALSLINSPKFRNMVLQVLVRTYEQLETPDYISVCQCYIFLDDAESTAQVLEKLVRGSKDDALIAYQIGFDLYESATQHFLRRVQEVIRAALPAPVPATPPKDVGKKPEELVEAVQETGGQGGVAVPQQESAPASEGESVPMQETGGPSVPVQETGDPGEGGRKREGELTGAGAAVRGGELTGAGAAVKGGELTGAGAAVRGGELTGAGAAVRGGELTGAGAAVRGGELTGAGAAVRGGELTGAGAAVRGGELTGAGAAVSEDKLSSKEEAMDMEQANAPDPASADNQTSREPEPEWVQKMRRVETILGGARTVALHQEFLIRNNHTDLQILKNTKESGRSSITHNGTVIANGLMHFGTTSDVFLREHLDWLKRASNWAKFSATASLGLIHYGHEKEALNLMSSYLPKDSTGSSPYAEGGGLYAIGLIHANHGLSIMDYIAQELKDNNSEVVRHGGCLGLGLAAMGTANLDAYDLLKENLMTRDDAVIGEAAGIAMGLVMIGTRSALALEDMINYARDTQHEKIQRGLALGISMLMYGQMTEADTLIEDLCRDKDPLLRRSGVFTVALAYCGSGDNGAIRKLLHVAVSDVDDDVRRAAVTSLGFILFRTPEQCPHVVSLLSESFNPHVRAGSAMALGICCAGTGSKEALSIIDPMLSDSIPFVQQAALVAAAMILIQNSEAMSSKVSFYRQHFAKVVADKHEDSLTKFGAIISQGIIDAGGRNVTISLQSRTGHMSMRTAVGLLVFSQFWFWYPLCHFLSLAFTPTALIALNSDLKMPKLQFRSGAKPSLYAYVAPLEKAKEKEKEKVATAELTVTAKAKAKAKKATLSASGTSVEAMEVDKEKNKDAAEKMDTSAQPKGAPASSSEPPTDGSKGGKDGDEKMDSEEPPALKLPKDSAKRGEDREDKMDTSTTEKEVAKKGEGAAKKGEGPSKKGEGPAKKGEGSGKKDGDKKAEPEPDFELLSNPTRVLTQQLKVLTLQEGCRYKPLKPVSVGGIIMLKDTDVEQPEDLIEPLKVAVPGQEDEGEEPPPPEPFEWTEEDDAALG